MNSRLFLSIKAVAAAALIGLLARPIGCAAQDSMPQAPKPQTWVSNVDTLMLYGNRQDTVPLPYIDVPSVFRLVQENVIIDKYGVLDPFFEKLRLVHLGLRTDTVHILHVGDSHVRGHIYPQAAGDVVRAAFTAVSYVDMGINGASSVTFTRPPRPAQIAARHPDLLILSFGTNESHGKRYSVADHYRQMNELLSAIRARMPEVPILLTTPPGSYESIRRSRRQRSYNINPRTVRAVQAICRFADEHRLAVWDLYDIVGGESRACLNWQEAELMRPDHVHYLPEGYAIQGGLLGQALLRAYNDKVKSYTANLETE